MFWLYVLSQATHSNGQSPHNIVPVEYRGAHNQEQVWRNDADMALAPCWQLHRTGPASADCWPPRSPPPAATSPPPQTFTDLRAAASGSELVSRLCAQKHGTCHPGPSHCGAGKAATAPAVLQAIESAHHQPLRWSHAQSRKYIENYITTWQSVMQLLQWNAADAAITPVAARYAQAH